MCFPGNVLKAVTFSYDDGVQQDARLVALFNKYHLKATFNLNSGLQTGANVDVKRGVLVRRMNGIELPRIYEGHEVAVHTLTHPHLEEQDTATIRNELAQDKANLEHSFGVPVVGMAYPYGTYNAQVIKLAQELGIRYARTTHSSGNFYPQQDLLEFCPTCHHKDFKLMQLAKEFVEMQTMEPRIFYVWGHSYEFDMDHNWEEMEQFCAFISNRADIFYGTNQEVLLSLKQSH